MMTPVASYPLTMQLGIKRFYGHVFLAPGRLYFICTKSSKLAAIGQGIGGLIGGAIAAAAVGKPGEAPQGIDEQTLQQAVAEHEGSMIMEAGQIEEIKETIWWRLIKVGGKKYGLPHGLGKELKQALGPWAKAHNVRTKGLPS